MTLTVCTCAKPNPWKSNTGKITNVCKECQGKILTISKQTTYPAEFESYYQLTDPVRKLHAFRVWNHNQLIRKIEKAKKRGQ